MLKLPKPEDDGLIIPEVGEWSRHKHHFLLRYVDAFTTAMRKKGWRGLHYIDIFAGAGIERDRATLELSWGSPMIATYAGFDGLHLCESNADKHGALDARVQRASNSKVLQVLRGDANERVHEIMAAIPDRSLSLAFLDPYGLHLEFNTLKTLSAKRADLIIFFPDRLDFLRNTVKYYFENPHSNLDRAMGSGADWRKVWNETPDGRKAEAMRSLYCDQIRTLGYAHFDFEGIPSEGRRLYWLIFCSKHKAGARIWRNTAEKKPSGQRTFTFEQDQQDR